MKKLICILVLMSFLTVLFGCAPSEKPAATENSETTATTEQLTSEMPEEPVFDIETSVCVLKYPQKWKAAVSVDVSKNIVRFSWGDRKLFDLIFGGDSGYLLGTYADVGVYVISYEPDKDLMSEEDFLTFCAMQEDINVILQNLMKDKNFVLEQ